MYILGIETSCDETAASVIRLDRRSSRVKVLSNVISSQIEIHKKYGGVIPEVAAREHVLNILPVIHESLAQAKVKPKDLGAIGVTKGPGLVTSLLTGMETVRTLAYTWRKPVWETNHIAGHIYANFIASGKDVRFPAVVLTVSGGHTILIRLSSGGKMKILGETRDDAAGEAFDKAAQMLGLGYPGGPLVSREAARHVAAGRPGRAIDLPRPMLNSPDFDFSFSGLKTALLYQIKADKGWRRRIPAYCSAFQQAVTDILIHKTIKAAKQYRAESVMLTGGVSANQQLRSELAAAVADHLPGTRFYVPEHQYTTDNAAMIAAATAFQVLYKHPATPWKKLRADSGLQLK